ncbi:hypothetical protein H072_11406 [Dactylellina haptotyla CBS 200.50]|uniref:Sodium/calcium exchanger membrane region domain-containing protein n=1 Tax=Dactylellina haptotyla (strain CBS 200.50) TaxID=1284197 RepID=S7ZX81_DACHA|nr:hypothetical protein H072_11406 [Dactylellina haptotyla CBS 200.50]
MFSKLPIYTSIVAICAAVAQAGAGAQVYGCIYLSSNRTTMNQYNFQVGIPTTQCMSSKGTNAVLQTKTGGVQCVSLGYVENQTTDHGTDNCAVRTSHWTVGYTSNVTVSGAAESKWHQSVPNNVVNLETTSPNTQICGSPSLCGNTNQITWESGTQGPIYFVFSPQVVNAVPDHNSPEYQKFYKKANALIDAIEDCDNKIKSWSKYEGRRAIAPFSAHRHKAKTDNETGVSTAVDRNTLNDEWKARKKEQRQKEKEKKKEERRRAEAHIDRSIIGQLKAALFSSYVNILLVFVPVGIALHFTNVSPIVVFVMNFMAIIPLAGTLSFATEEIALRTGETLGGLLNASFGNAVELIVSIIALTKHEIVVVQTSLIGSILSNLLLVMGMAFFFGGINRVEQFFNTTVAQTASSLLAVAVLSLIIPSAFHWAGSSNVANVEDLQPGIIGLSRGTSVILLIVYGVYLFFQLKSHAELFNMQSQKAPKRSELEPSAMQHLLQQSANAGTATIGHPNVQGQSYPRNSLSPATASGSSGDTKDEPVPEEEEEEEEGPQPELLLITSIIILAGSTVLVAICAEFLVSSIDYLTEHSSISKYFVGLILLPIVGNAAEHATSVTVAYKDKMDLAIGVAVGSSMQIALLVIPFIVVLGWIMGIDEMTLFFDGFQVVLLLVSVLLVNYLIQDGKSNFLEGTLLMATYLIIAVAAWYFPSPKSETGQ